jgi:predicted ATPase
LKLKSIRIRNFLSFGEDPLEMAFGDAAVSFIVGPNNSGKSNIFRALNFVGEAITRTPLPSEVSQYLRPETRDFEVVVEAELNETELQALRDFMECSTMLYRPGGPNTDEQLMTIAAKEVLTKHRERLFGGLGKKITIIVKGTRLEDSPVTHLYRLSWNNEEFLLQRDAYLTKQEIPETTGFSPRELGSMLFEGLKLIHPSQPGSARQSQEAVYEPFEPRDPPSLISSGLAAVVNPIQASFAGISVNYLNFREFDQRVGTSAELRRLRGFLSARGFKETGLTIGALLALLYSSSVVWVADLRGRPSDHVPIAWERSVEREVLPVWGTMARPKIKLILADNLAGWLFGLLTGGDATDQLRYEEIQREFERFTKLRFRIYLSEDEVTEEPNLTMVRVPPGQSGLGFGSANTSEFAALGIKIEEKRKKVKVAGIQITDGKASWPVEFASAGTIEVLCLLTGVIGSKSGILLLDEPVQNMHPEFQYLFLRLLERRTKADRNQVLVTTHSPFLITRGNLGNTWYVMRNNGETVALNLMQKLAERYPDLSRSVIQQFDSSDVRSLLFSRGAVFVEGLTDKWILQEIDRKASAEGRGPKLVEKEWPVVAMNTKDNTPAFLGLAELLQLNHAFLLDRDAEPIVAKALRERGIAVTDEKTMREHGFYLLKTKIDDLFKITGGSKPRKALEKVVSMTLEDVPSEFKEFLIYLEQRTSRPDAGVADPTPV